MARPPVFLPEARYRQKRVRDAAHIVPVLGAALFLVPLLWTPSAEPGGIGNAAALLYVLGVWAGLVLVAFLMARALRPDAEEADRPEEEDAP